MWNLYDIQVTLQRNDHMTTHPTGLFAAGFAIHSFRLIGSARMGDNHTKFSRQRL